MANDREEPHPFALWADAPPHERGMLSRRALRLYGTTNQLIAVYFEHGLHIDESGGVKSLAEMSRDLQNTCSPRQVYRELKAVDPACASIIKSQEAARWHR